MRRRLVLFALGLALLLPAAWSPAAAAPVPPTWATYVGGPAWDEVDDVALDAEGNAYVVGTTNYYGEPCCRDDTWAAKYAPDGRQLWRVEIGGPSFEHTLTIAVRAGVVAIGGFAAAGFPTTPGTWRPTSDDAYGDPFVMRLDPATGAVRWATWAPADIRLAAVDLDDAGNVYVAGSTNACGHPTTVGAYQPWHADGCGGPADGILLKLSPDGARALYLTYLGGPGGEHVDSIAVSPSSGSLLVTGTTWSSAFDVTAGAYDTTYNGDGDAFVAKLDASGQRLLFGTYFGGPGHEGAQGIARDASSNVYVAGITETGGLPVTPGAYQTDFVGGDCGHSKAYRECYDIFVAKLDSSGAALRYATYLGADKDDWTDDVSVDASGAAYLAGHTNSPNFPMTDGWGDASGDSVPLVAAVSPSGRALLYSTTFPTPHYGVARGLEARADGRVLVGGYAHSFPVTPGAHDTTNESAEGFLAMLGAPTQQLVFDHTGGSEWFVEVALGGREVDLVTTVEARDTGGEWKTLTKQPYGKWADGYHVEPGNTVQFRATLSNGVVRTSCAFTHPAGNCTDGGGTDPGAFDATFTGVKGNEWWVEARVSGTEPITKVEASVDGGAWRALSLRSWGAWAASFHVPSGSIVQLRATGSSGATDLSGCYQWTAATSVDCGDDGGTEPGSFDATFSGVKGNEWWVEARVSGNEPLTAVHATTDGGATWKALSLRSWGAWAASFHVPEGTIVQLRATSSSGATDLSGCYRWTAATPVECGNGGGGGGTEPTAFDATFKNVRGNEWWVETEVAVTGGTLAGVDARVDGGAWQALTKQSWGSWAKSIHAPAGSTVEFRARATDGSTDESSAYRWPPG